MILLDVNVLVYAHREDAAEHPAFHAWLTGTLADPGPFGVSNLVLSGFLRVVTHPKVFVKPTPLAKALDFVRVIRSRPNCVIHEPGPRHWEIFEKLCTRAGARGNYIPDAFHAALAIETGSEFLTTDRGFGRFPDLRWRHPLD